MDTKNIYKYEDSKCVLKDNGAVGNLLMKKEGVEFVNLTLDKDSKVDKHALPFPVDFFVISGKGTLLLDDSKIEIEKGDMFRAEPNISRAIESNRNDSISLLVIKHMD